MKKLGTRIMSVALAVIMVLALTCIQTTTVEAKGKTSSTTTSKEKSRYKDVNSKTKYGKEIVRIGKYGALRDLEVKSGKIFPGKYVTKKQFVKILERLYGPEVAGTVKKKNQNDIVTQKWAYNRLEETAERLGVTIHWKGGTPKGKVTRAQACRYICQQIDLDVNLEPTRK